MMWKAVATGLVILGMTGHAGFAHSEIWHEANAKFEKLIKDGYELKGAYSLPTDLAQKTIEVYVLQHSDNVFRCVEYTSYKYEDKTDTLRTKDKNIRCYELRENFEKQETE